MLDMICDDAQYNKTPAGILKQITTINAGKKAKTLVCGPSVDMGVSFCEAYVAMPITIGNMNKLSGSERFGNQNENKPGKTPSSEINNLNLSLLIV